MYVHKMILQDLAYYLGPDWKKGYAPRESVCQYLKHLEKLEAENPYFLLAYVYHLYMGLLSGGQILRRKRALLQKLKFSRKVIISLQLIIMNIYEQESLIKLKIGVCTV